MQTSEFRNVLDEVTILESHEVGKDIFEVCACANATQDECTSEMIVELGSFVRQIIHSGTDLIFRPPWLPRNNHVKMHVSREEAADAGKEIAENWRVKVRKSIPPPSLWQKNAAWLRAAVEPRRYS
jgi:hypothetical protein